MLNRNDALNILQGLRNTEQELETVFNDLSTQHQDIKSSITWNQVQLANEALSMASDERISAANSIEHGHYQHL